MTGNDIYNSLVNLGVPAGDARKLVATGYSESGMNNTIPGDGGNSIGLFQIYMPAHPDKLTILTGSSRKADWISWLQVPENNIKAAAAVYKSQGLGAWTEYRNGHYKQYLGLADSKTDLANISNVPASTLTGSDTGTIEMTGYNPPVAADTGSLGGASTLTAFGFLIACLFLSLVLILGGLVK